MTSSRPTCGFVITMGFGRKFKKNISRFHSAFEVCLPQLSASLPPLRLYVIIIIISERCQL